MTPKVPLKLEEIIHKALEKDRGLRYHSAADLRIDLTRLKREIDSGLRATAAASTATPDVIAAHLRSSSAAFPGAPGPYRVYGRTDP